MPSTNNMNKCRQYLRPVVFLNLLNYIYYINITKATSYHKSVITILVNFALTFSSLIFAGISGIHN